MSKNVLITGSSSGFGLLTAKTLADRGYTVFATMRDPAGRNQPVANELSSYGDASSGEIHVLDLDVTSQDSVDRAVRTILDQAGKLDVVVNNAGIGVGGLAEAFTVEEYQQIFDINVFGVQRISRAVLPSMREAGEGLVINVSSMMGRLVIPFAAPYTATKYALEGLTESYRYELAGTGVDVAIVEPGGFKTGFMGRMLYPADEACTASYGAVSEMGQKMWSGFAEAMHSDDGPNPQELADAILRVIETPAGERPLRTVVDPFMGGEGATAINKLTDQVQEEFLKNVGVPQSVPATVPA